MNEDSKFRHDISWSDAVTPGATWVFDFIVVDENGDPITSWTGWDDWAVYFFKSLRSGGPTIETREAAALATLKVNAGLILQAPPTIRGTVLPAANQAIPVGERAFEVWSTFNGVLDRRSFGILPVIH